MSTATPDIQSPAPSRVRALSAVPGPPGLPLLGNLLQLDLGRLHLQLEGWAQRYGDLYRIRIGPRQMLVVSDTELVLKLLRERPETFVRQRNLREAVDSVGATGVFSAEGEDWTRQRHLMMGAMGPGQLGASYDALLQLTRRFSRRLRHEAERGATIDPLHEMTRYTVNVTCALIFGYDMNTLEEEEHPLERHLATMRDAINRRMIAPFPYWRYVKLPADRALDRSLGELSRTIRDLIQRARRELERDPSRAAAPRSLLDAMIVARDVDAARARFTDKEVYGNVLTLLQAGEDTTACTLAWTLYYMAQHPEVQARMQEEVDAQLGEADLPARVEDCQKLRYIAAVVHEVLRLRSVAPLNLVEPRSDTVVGDVLVPAGTGIFVATRSLALDAENFGAARTFDPSRWLGTPPGGGAHEPRASLAFGAGGRVCPGRALALLECTLVCATVARELQISPVAGAGDVEERFAFTMSPRGLRLVLSPRPRARRAEPAPTAPVSV